jgi:hypothetical protein
MANRLQHSLLLGAPRYQDVNIATYAVMLDSMLKANIRHELVYVYVRTGLVIGLGQVVPADRAQDCDEALKCWHRIGVKQRRAALGEISRWVRVNLPFDENSPSNLSH